MTAAFIDTNVLLYLVSADTRKAAIAEDLLRAGGHVSVQNLAELTAVCRRKAKMSWEDIDLLRSLVRQQCRVHSLTISVHNRAFEISAKTGYSIFDAQVLAAAAKAECGVVLSEDMQDGHDLSSLGLPLMIRNPFAGDHQ